MIIINPKIDFYLIKFPIIFPAIYLISLYLFPSLENIIIILTILLLAEPHFGATWPFFLDKSNKDYIIKNRIPLIIIPLFIVIFSLIGFFTFNSLFLLIFYAANVYHVTRQSVGVGILYTKDEKEKKYQKNIIYICNLLFFVYGYFRFYLDIINENNNFQFFLFVNLIVVILNLIYLFTFKNKNFFICLTGSIIFLPITFVSNPVHAIIMGVTMHYSQYLILTYKVTLKRILSNFNYKYSFKRFINLKFFLVIFIYSLLMTGLSYLSKSDSEIFRNLIIIPIVGQMLHFYIDSQLWKFSIQHNRENVLNYLKESF